MGKYTDEQIKQALECCRYKSNSNCDCCPYREVAYCCDVLHRDAVDLINRQEAKTERLKEKNRLANQCTLKAIRRARAEAITEFAEMLIDNTVPVQVDKYQYDVITKAGINYYTARALIKVGESK